MLRAGLGFFVTVIVARLLGPEQFGLFSLFVVIMIITANLLGEGMDVGVVRYYARIKTQQPILANEILLSALMLRLALGIIVVLIALSFGDTLATVIFNDSSYTIPIVYGLIGAFLAALWSFALATIQANENFDLFSVVTPVVNILRLLIIPLLLLFGYFNLHWVVLSQIIIYFLCSLALFYYLRKHFLDVKPRWSHIKQQYRYGRWTCIASLCFVVTSYAGVAVLNYFSGAKSAGVYSAAVQLLIVVDQITIVILTVQLPALSRFTQRQEFVNYVKRFVPIFVLLALIILPSLFFVSDLIALIYGESYLASATLFQIMLIGFLATLITHPLQLILLSGNMPHYYAGIHVFSLITWVGAAALLIPSYGALGAAWSMLISRLLQALIIVYFVWYALRQTNYQQTFVLKQSVDS